MKRKFRVLSTILILFIIVGLSIGYSAFQSSMVVSDIKSIVRAYADIRVTGISASGGNNGYTSYDEYNVTSIESEIVLPNTNSTITYSVEITNLGSQDMALTNITGLPNTMEIKNINYTYGTKLCDNNRCHNGSVNTITFTVGYKSTVTEGSNESTLIHLDLTFKKVFSITYNNFNDVTGLATEILEDETKTIDFSSLSSVPNNVSVSGATGSYSNSILTLSEAVSDVVVTNASVEIIDNDDGTTTTITTTENQDGSTTTVAVTTDNQGNTLSTSETETTTTENQDGSTSTSSTTTNYDANGDVTSTSETETTTNQDGSSSSTTTNYDANGDETGSVSSETDSNGNTSTQETTVVNGEDVVTGYSITTPEDGSYTVESGTGVDSGVLALDGNPFTIHLVANVAINKSTSGTNGNGGRVVISALEPTATGATTYKGFAFFVEKSNNKMTLYASSSSAVQTGSNKATWGTKLENCSVTASNSTYTQHTIDITYTPGSGNSNGTISLTLDGTTSSVTSSTIPSSLSNATISVGTLGVEHTRDITAMEIIEFTVTKTIS